MVTHGVFSVFDSKGGVWSPPFIARNAAVATRIFEQAVNDPNGEISKYPADYALMECGQWDEDSGYICGDTPKNLGIGSQFVRRLKLEGV